jgi:hypothetical protein
MPFPPEEMRRFRAAWTDLQTRFVDDPQQAVRGADQLVAEVLQAVMKAFAQHKHELEGSWQRGSETSEDTENLRLALRHYRTFFKQLLHT